jgi:trehalose 6-phosphate synthase
LRRRLTFIQIAAPSREMVPEYTELRSTLESISGRINGRFGDFDWVPLRYLNRSFSRARLVALYRLCKVGLVTPLCDGMNLVAKEYVATQDPADPGVLVLSRFAGAAEELSGALIVNPHDTQGLARALETALDMPRAERLRRWRPMMAELRRNDITNWRRGFLDALEAARRPGPVFAAAS